MAREIPWHKSISAKLGGTVFVFALFVIGLVIANVMAYARIQSDLAWLTTSGDIRRTGYMTLFLANQTARATGPARDQYAQQLRDETSRAVALRRALLDGAPERGVEPASDPRIIQNLERRDDRWKEQIDPLVKRVLASPPGTDLSAELASLEQLLTTQTADVDAGNELANNLVKEQADRFRLLNNLLAILTLVMLAAVFVIARNLSRRTSELAASARRIASGDLAHRATESGSDEVAVLAESFNDMTGTLRGSLETERDGRAALEALIGTVAEAVARLSANSAEILAATTQQASGAQEQAAAVAQTVTTVDEVTQTAEQAADRAKSVAAASQRAVDIGADGSKAIERSIDSIATVRTHVESIAEGILTLAEQAQAIGDIISTVDDLAERTNLLALNAAIEASRAGEAGRGFSVVASEVKALADQSKKATAQVGQILGEIQRATNDAVFLTEQGSRSVDQASEVVDQTGETIRTLLGALEQAAQVAAQIAASAGQQATGMSQVHTAMSNINQATSQNVIASRQAERAAQDLSDLAGTLKARLDGSRPRANG
jgi:methyl-accepting chemotaxis protein